jgi:hypothetical protein
MTHKSVNCGSKLLTRKPATREYLATLDDAAFGAASDVTPKLVSPSDPAAQWTGAMRGPAFFAYADNYLIDVKFGIISDVLRVRQPLPLRPQFRTYCCLAANDDEGQIADSCAAPNFL